MHSSSLLHRSARWRASRAHRAFRIARTGRSRAEPRRQGGGKNVGSPPTISGTPTASVTVGQAYSFRPSASDPDGDRLSFRVRNLPTWARFDGSTGTLNGAPTSSQRRYVLEHRDPRYRWQELGNPAGVLHYRGGTAADDYCHAEQCTDDFRLAREQRHRRPGVHVPADRCRCGRRPLTFSVRGNPSWLSINSTDGTLCGHAGGG